MALFSIKRITKSFINTSSARTIAFKITLKMKRILSILLLCMITTVLHAEYEMLDSLRLTENFTFNNKVMIHKSKVSGTSNDSTIVLEFVYEESLYIMSSVFSLDYNEYVQKYSDVPSLIQKIMSVCPTECIRGDCGYTFTYDSDLPSTLTLYTFPNMDTIQYVTTQSPELYVAIIRDTIFGSSNIRCGISLQELFDKVSISPLYYDHVKFKNIVIIPHRFNYDAYQKKGYMSLPNSCFVIENKNGIISKIEIRQTDYFNKKTIMQDLEFY